MSDKCVWKRDEVSDRAWFVPPHEGEDDEPPEVQHVWSFCPFCGKPLGFESAPETPEAMHARIVTETADALAQEHFKGDTVPLTARERGTEHGR